MTAREQLAALVECYKSGLISAPLMIDNDTASVSRHIGPGEDDYAEIFEMHPEELLEVALDLLGIPHEHV